MGLEQTVIGIAFAVCAFMLFCVAVPLYVLRHAGPRKPPPLPSGKVPVAGFGLIDVVGVSLFFGLYAVGWQAMGEEGSTLDEMENLPSVLLVQLMVHAFFVATVLGFLFWRVNVIEAFGLRWRRWYWVFLLAPAVVVIMKAFQVGLSVAGYEEWMVHLVGEDNQQEAVKLMSESSDPLTLALMGVVACIGAPVAEEVIFRGYLYPAMKRFTNIPVAVVFSGLLFGAVHLNLAALLPLTILGFVLALAYEYTGSLWAPIAIHFCFNLPTVLFLLLMKLNPEFLEELEKNAAFIGSW